LTPTNPVSGMHNLACSHITFLAQGRVHANIHATTGSVHCCSSSSK